MNPAGELQTQPARRKFFRRAVRTFPTTHETAYRIVPWPAWVLFGVAVLVELFTANPLLSVASTLLIPIFMSLLWRKDEPPVLLFACGLQWLQVSTIIYYADFCHVNLSALTADNELVRAIWLSLLGLLALALGMRLALAGKIVSAGPQARSDIVNWSPLRLFAVYLAAFILFGAMKWIAFRVPQITQALVALANVKWVLFFLLAYTVIQKRRGIVLLALVVLLEFGVGFLAFFSAFKSVVFLLLIALLVTRSRFTPRQIALGSFLAVSLLAACIVWTGIKDEYRGFLNQGTGEQVVLVPVKERIRKLTQLLLSAKKETFAARADALVTRISYVKYFSLTIANVPLNLPHENGRLWLSAVEHVMKPRLLFPDKPAIDDSERTSKYTGTFVAGAERGTSISMGYMAESYVDFGAAGMFAPIFLLGIFYGLVYRWFVLQSGFKAAGFAIATTILVFNAANFETSNVKIIGGVLIGVIVMAAIQWTVLPAFMSWMNQTWRTR